MRPIDINRDQCDPPELHDECRQCAGFTECFRTADLLEAEYDSTAKQPPSSEADSEAR